MDFTAKQQSCSSRQTTAISIKCQDRGEPATTIDPTTPTQQASMTATFLPKSCPPRESTPIPPKHQDSEDIAQDAMTTVLLGDIELTPPDPLAKMEATERFLDLIQHYCELGLYVDIDGVNKWLPKFQIEIYDPKNCQEIRQKSSILRRIEEYGNARDFPRNVFYLRPFNRVLSPDMLSLECRALYGDYEEAEIAIKTLDNEQRKDRKIQLALLHSRHLQYKKVLPILKRVLDEEILEKAEELQILGFCAAAQFRLFNPKDALHYFELQLQCLTDEKLEIFRKRILWNKKITTEWSKAGVIWAQRAWPVDLTIETYLKAIRQEKQFSNLFFKGPAEAYFEFKYFCALAGGMKFP